MDLFTFDCEGLDTLTSRDQRACECACLQYLPYQKGWNAAVGKHLNTSTSTRTSTINSCNQSVSYIAEDDKNVTLNREMHVSYLMNGLENQLVSGFVSLDSSRPWILYWITHTIALLGVTLSNDLQNRVISTLSHMQNDTGGFAGGPQQISHCAPTYAAVLCLVTIGTTDALSIINREKLHDFFIKMKDPQSGAFRMHKDGEIDSRSTYTVLAVARILNILTPELIHNTADYIASCATYEGGYGAEPYNEAHGGYNFCCIASLIILKQAHKCRLDSQEKWLYGRQMQLEGGFQGRTNKLVDSCYSFWQGAAISALTIIRANGSDTADMDAHIRKTASSGSSSNSSSSSSISSSSSSIDKNTASAKYSDINVDDSDGDIVIDLEELDCIIQPNDDAGEYMFNQKAVQRYILHCAQHEVGGMRDKPGKSRDFYHSCYALSGLSIAQNSFYSSSSSGSLIDAGSGQVAFSNRPVIYGDSDNLLLPTSVIFNVLLDRLAHAVNYYR